ncbi:MAG TPA: ATP-binding protein, partial [Deltaproteobacteria bacterium]|nr:ATP-binding protein [Deltaproteobacteria bacterium]
FLTHDLLSRFRKRIDLYERWIRSTRQVNISDSGTGMPATIISKVFDPFFMTKQRGEGTGMGLSVVHGIVKEMKGSISVLWKGESGKLEYKMWS